MILVIFSKHNRKTFFDTKLIKKVEFWIYFWKKTYNIIVRTMCLYLSYMFKVSVSITTLIIPNISEVLQGFN